MTSSYQEFNCIKSVKVIRVRKEEFDSAVKANSLIISCIEDGNCIAFNKPDTEQRDRIEDNAINVFIRKCMDWNSVSTKKIPYEAIFTIQSQIKEERKSNIKQLIATICCSTRYRDDIVELYNKLTEEGYIVLADLTDHERQEEFDKDLVDDIHRRKMEMSDVIYFIVKDGYMGESVSREYEYAKKIDKDIVILDKTDYKEKGDN